MYSIYTHAHKHTYIHSHKYLVVWDTLAQATRKRIRLRKMRNILNKVKESKAYWGVVCSLPKVSLLSKPHPTTAQAQTPNPLCVPSLSLILFLSTIPLFLSGSLKWIFVSPLLSYYHLLFFLSFYRLNHRHFPFRLSDFAGCLCLWLHSGPRRPSQYSTQALGCNKQTIATSGVAKHWRSGFLSKLSLTACDQTVQYDHHLWKLLKCKVRLSE